MIQSVDITPGLEVKNYIEEDNISEKKNKQKTMSTAILSYFKYSKTPKSVTKYKTPPIELDKILFLKKNP